MIQIHINKQYLNQATKGHMIIYTIPIKEKRQLFLLQSLKFYSQKETLENQKISKIYST